jgi:hypothetical protein
MEGGGMQVSFGSVLGALAMGGMVLCFVRATQPTHCCIGIAAIATLRNLSNVQEDFQKSGRIDVDGDGRGEYGTFGELTGVAGLRTNARGSACMAAVSPPVLSPSLANADFQGIVTKAGFAFRIFLPAERGGASREGRPGQALTAPVDSAAASRSWCAYAWPVHEHYGPIRGCRQHDRTFFVDDSGTLWYAENAYWGLNKGPEWDAAMPRDGKGPFFAVAAAEATEIVGRDGRTWKRLP